MTILRTALRLCVAACLKGTAEARPTIAGPRIYDSRVSDFAPDSDPNDAMPTAIILTDKDEGEQLSLQNGGPPFRRNVDLVIEFGMIQRIFNDETGEFDYLFPDTDARHEAALDIFETQIVHRLAYNLTDPFAALFRDIARPIKYDCHRQVTDEAGIKIAARVLTLTCDCGDDKVLVHKVGSVPTGIEALPEPMRSVARLIDPATEAGKICAAVAAALNPQAVDPLEAMTVVLTQPAGTPSITVPLDMDLDGQI